VELPGDELRQNLFTYVPQLDESRSNSFSRLILIFKGTAQLLLADQALLQQELSDFLLRHLRLPHLVDDNGIKII
jgi:hypothetical protein